MEEKGVHTTQTKKGQNYQHLVFFLPKKTRIPLTPFVLLFMRTRSSFFFFLLGFPPLLLPFSTPVSGARYIPGLAWFLPFGGWLCPLAAHPRPLIGRTCHFPSLTSEVSAPTVTVIMVGVWITMRRRKHWYLRQTKLMQLVLCWIYWWALKWTISIDIILYKCHCIIRYKYAIF